MPINNYESVIIVNASLEDEQIETTYQRVHEFITSNGGEFQDVEKWGRKRLAYPIQKSKSGYYIVMRFAAPTEMISKLERTYRLDETIVRFLTVQLDKEAVAHYETLRNKKEEEPEKSESEVTESTEQAES